jgi:ATP-dependent RNA helicase SUPV3L1/SUV3
VVLPPPGTTVVAGGAPLAGFRRVGNQQIRVDLVERIARAAHDARAGRKPFAPDPALATSMGLSADSFAKLMARLGFAPVKGDVPQWVWRGRPKLVSPKIGKPVRENAFSALAELGFGRG